MTALAGSRFIVMSGLPASGKSTLGRELARVLSLPALDKDAALEALFEADGVGDVPGRRELSRAADVIFEGWARQSEGAVLTSWWKHPRSQDDSGTSTAWLATLPGKQFEIYCQCEPRTAAQRFLRRKRHPGHLDGRWSGSELLASFERAAALGPLGVGELIEVDTGGADCSGKAYAQLVESVRKVLCRPAHAAAS